MESSGKPWLRHHCAARRLFRFNQRARRLRLRHTRVVYDRCLGILFLRVQTV
jgi:hypothetical protein